MIKFCFEDNCYHREPELITLCLNKCTYFASNGMQLKNRSVYDATLLFVRSGVVMVEDGNETHNVSAGKAAIISSNTNVKIAGIGEYSVYAVEFNCFPDIFAGENAKTEVLLPDRDDIFSYEKLYEKFCAGVPVERCEVILLDLLYGLLFAEKEKNCAERLFDGFCEYCREHLKEPFGVSDAAAALGCGKDHLSRTVKRMCGMTAKEYVIEQKLSAAKVYLRAGDEPIDRVGKMLGFPSAELFNKFLKYHLGKTAAAIRKESE